MIRPYILHYSLGFPPYRSGGMTRFAIDLMRYQFNAGYKVAMLWPGRIKNGKTKIKKTMFGNYLSFEIVNPLPVSLCNGIIDLDAYTKKGDKDVFLEFLRNENPNIIHVHTLEGLHFEFLEAAKELGIKLLYTTHDFFGLCPTNFLYRENDLCQWNCTDCSKCNINAFSSKEIAVLQSKSYAKLKNTFLFKLLRKVKRKSANKGTHKNIDFSCDYGKLRDYYLRCFNLFDCIHCNSSVTFEVFSRFLNNPKKRVVNITHLGIHDMRSKRKICVRDKLTFAFIGSETNAKGFFYLIEILDELWIKRKDFSLVVYSQDNLVKREYLLNKGRFDDFSSIANDFDVLIVPSLSYETFGFIVLEAYMHAIPAVVTKRVGSKDLIENEVSGFISSVELLGMTITKLLDNKTIVYEVSENIKNSNVAYSFEDMERAIYGDQ